ncbi:hypothetical protein ACFW32_37355, partial [Streptomyces mutabilis]|uniref:hypothetical protein n=1 Tax=Streptomyces mutabilis TaxID=67332 RepID=UPI0036ABC518
MQALKSAVSEPEIYGLDVREIRAQAIGPSAPFREIRLGERFQRCLSRVRTALAMTVMRLGLM